MLFVSFPWIAEYIFLNLAVFFFCALIRTDQHRFTGVFPKWNSNSGNLIHVNHWNRNKSQFKYLVCHMCRAGAVVASLSLTEKVVVSNPFSCDDKYFCHWVQWKHFGENSTGLLMLTALKRCTRIFLFTNRFLPLEKLRPICTVQPSSNL